ncbi:MAG TPA: D-2-hydroxyacid dehydrogenase [Polyangiaceae bacterium]
MTSLLITTRVRELAEPRLLAVVPGANLITVDESGTLSGDAGTAEIVFLSSDLIAWARRSDGVQRAVGRLAGSPALAWLHTASVGVDHPMFGYLLRRGVRLTNAPGIHATPIAEYVMAHLLAIAKRIPEHAALQARAEYLPLDSDELTGKTLGIVGFGGIGRATAKLARAFGMRIVAVRRTPAPDPLVDRMLPPEGLDELLSESHAVVLALPLTNETRGLLDRARLGRLRPDAVLVNVGRGGVVDEAALVDTLASGRIRAAVLDVHAEEPLPADSPLWRLERAIVTPHDASSSPMTLERAIAGFLLNLDGYVGGRPLADEIHPERPVDR